MPRRECVEQAIQNRQNVLGARYTKRYDDILLRRIMGDEIPVGDEFYIDTYDPFEWWTVPFHRWCFAIYIVAAPIIILRSVLGVG